MSHQDNSPADPFVGDAPRGGDSGPQEGGPDAGRLLTSARVAHELANLLDGSLRNIGMVISQFERSGLAGLGAGGDEGQGQNLLGKLQVADHAMRRMAILLRRWTLRQQDPDALGDRDQTLGQVFDDARGLFEPVASMQGIDIRVSIDDGARGLPAGPVYMVVVNGLLNSIQAITLQVGGQRGGHGAKPRSDGKGWWVDLAARVVGDEVELMICDNGPGLDPAVLDDQGCVRFGQTSRPGGQGVGLVMIREIVQGLGGVVELSNQDPCGAKLAVRYPLRAVGGGQSEQG